MSEKPVWRIPYDTAERLVAPHADAWVRSGQFAALTAVVKAAQAVVGQGVTDVATKVWHVVNLPAASDVQRLRVQIGALDREVRRLSMQLDKHHDDPDGE